MIREDIKTLVRDLKERSGLTYDQLVENTGLSKRSITYILNKGVMGKGLETLIDYLTEYNKVRVKIDIEEEE